MMASSELSAAIDKMQSLVDSGLIRTWSTCEHEGMWVVVSYHPARPQASRISGATQIEAMSNAFKIISSGEAAFDNLPKGLLSFVQR